MRAPATSTLTRRARTDWRKLGAWALIVAATSAGLYFGVSERVVERITRERGAACVELKNGRPSPGCERIARLVLRTCALRPEFCSRAIQRERRRLSPARRRQLDRFLKRILDDGRAADRAARETQREERSRGGTGGGRGERRPPGGDPSAGGGGSGGAAPAAGGGGSGEGGAGGGASRPSPSDAVNDAAGRVRDSANDVTDAAGAGRPVPRIPTVPQTPPVPDLLPDLPCVEVPPAVTCAMH